MKQANVDELRRLKSRLLENHSLYVRQEVLARALSVILALFDQGDAQLFALGECVDDLASHTGYQLKEKTLNPAG